MRKIREFFQKPVHVYFMILAFSGLGLGLSDSILSNFFKDAYNITAFQRGIIEFPRELPGVLCAVVISMLSSLGDIKTAIIAQALSTIGLLLLGLLSPSFSVMLIFLFINSMGMHMYMPINDSVGMNIAEKDKIGVRMGQYNGFKTIFSLIASLMVFFGFKSGIFTFKTTVKPVFLIGVGCFIICLLLFIKLHSMTKDMYPTGKKVKIFFKKKYKFYYMLAVLHGAQKQIMFVYAPWVIIDLLGKGADTLAMLAIIGSLLGVFFLPRVGKWVDRFGVKKLLFADAFSFIFVYIAYGVLALCFTETTTVTPWLILITYALFISDKLSMQFGMVKVIYLKKIADSQSDVTPTLSLGISMDHVISIIFGFIGGVTWTAFGPQYVFFSAAILSLTNVVVAALIKNDPRIAPQK